MNEAHLTLPETHTNFSNFRRHCIIGLYAMFAIDGSIQVAFPDNAVLYILSVLVCASLATGWAVFDARIRAITFLPVFQMLYFLVWPIGAVIYLIYRSGVRGLVTAVVHGLGLAATLAVAFYTTFYGLHYTGMLDARYYQ